MSEHEERESTHRAKENVWIEMEKREKEREIVWLALRIIR